MYVQLGSINPATVDDAVQESLDTYAAEDWIVVRDGVSITTAVFESLLTTDELVAQIRDGLITEVVRYHPMIERSEELETVGALYADQFTLDERVGGGW